MKIIFNINYYTNWGEELFITGSIPQLGNWNTDNALKLKYSTEGTWFAEIDTDTPEFEYRYFVANNNNFTIERGNKHVFSLKDKQKETFVFDEWRTTENLVIYNTSAFKDIIYKRSESIKKQRESHPEKSILFNLYAPRVKNSYGIGVIGNCYELGAWNETNFLELSSDKYPFWQLKINLSHCNLKNIQYKYVLFDLKSKKIIDFEEGENRKLALPDSEPDTFSIICNNDSFRKDISNWKSAGVSIPVFSIRSKNGFGIGEFPDIKKMVDWVVKTKQRIIQFLPINDTTDSYTWKDSYPYKAMSMYALHPIYINIEKLGKLDTPLLAAYKKEKRILNAKETVDYDSVITSKWKYIKILYAQNHKQDFETQAYKSFFLKNKNWLIPYAAYSCLRDENKTGNFNEWKKYAVYQENEIIGFCKLPENEPKVNVYYYIQFHLHLQLKEVSDYARSKGIILKGDIPIGVNRYSVEAWTEPELFHMHAQAGAPPDDFSIIGQNWGFPTYNWEKMEKTKYAWWKKRFQAISTYFDAYRIDHLLGLFRIFEIPVDSIHGLLGYFNPALPMSIEEIEKFDNNILFDNKRFVEPYITNETLLKYFPDYIDEVKNTYLIQDENTSDIFHLKPQFDTQKKIQKHFASKEQIEKNQKIADGLMFLLDEVLFIEDPYRQGLFHPRISINNSLSFRNLPNNTQDALNKLYYYYYYERHNEFWAKEATKKLKFILESTDMLACGEDLGMIPPCVPEVMRKLQLLSLEIQRMPKTPGVLFEKTTDFPYLSVCTTSTHDMSTMRQWWQNSDRNLIQHYYNHVLGEYGNAPLECESCICQKIIKQHLLSPAIFAIFPIQDWFGINAIIRNKNIDCERINDPANPDNYWNYRMHITLEDLLEDQRFNTKIAEMINQSERALHF